MLSLALQTLRSRWAIFAGTFVALTLGVCLMAVTLLTLAATISKPRQAPLWYSNAEVVITGSNTVAFPSDAGGSRTTTSLESIGVPDSIIDHLAKIEGVAEIVIDRRIPVEVDDTALTARPWPSAALHPYTFVSGKPPTSNDEVVLTSSTGRHPGDRVTVQTPAGPRQWKVSGIMESPVPAAYLTDEAAAELAAGRIDAIGVQAANEITSQELARQIRQAVGSDDLRVLVGDSRHEAEPDPDAQLLVVSTALLGNAAGISGFAAISVLIGTFEFAVAQRRREFALLRASGATPAQVYWLVLGEALMVGLAAAVTGGALGAGVAPLFSNWLSHIGFAPAGFTPYYTFWPLAVAGSIGLLVAVLGSIIAGSQASRVRPIEALRDAAVDRGTMTIGRWVLGIACLGLIPLLLPTVMGFEPGPALSIALGITLMALAGVALLSPVLIPIIIRVVGWPFNNITTGMLARSNTLNSLRRTSSTAAPILITVGLAGSTLIGSMTLQAAQRQMGRERITVSTLVVATSPAGLADPTVAALENVPGIRAAVPARQSVVYLDTGQSGGPYDFPALYLGEGAGAVLRLPALEGSLADLRGVDTVAVSRKLADARNWQLGGTAHLWLADSTQVHLRVVAILANSVDLGGTLLLPWELQIGHGPQTGADMVYLVQEEGVSVSTATDTAEQIVALAGGQTVTAGEFITARSVEENRIDWAAIFTVIGLALLYTAISIANTFIMATADRVRDLAVLRLGGATQQQVMGMIAMEALLVTMAGTVLGILVSIGMLVMMRVYLSNLMEQPPAVISWAWLGLIASCSLIIALVASILSALASLRTPPVRVAAVRE